MENEFKSACSSLTPEQIEEYKKMGEYMYNNNDYNINMTGSKIKPPQEQDLLAYAIQGLNAGLEPNMLSGPEIQALTAVYGERWFEKFGFKKEDVIASKSIGDAVGPASPAPKPTKEELRALLKEKIKLARNK